MTAGWASMPATTSRASWAGVNCLFPVDGGQLVRGSRQRAYFVEYDGPLARTFLIQVLGEP